MTGDGSGSNRENARGSESTSPGTSGDGNDDTGSEEGPTTPDQDTEETVPGDPSTAGNDRPDPPAEQSAGVLATVRWFLHTDDDPIVFVREFAQSAAIVLLVGALLFAVSGVWPPMVAVESPSMAPHMQPGDLVFLMDEERFPPAVAQSGTGVVTRQAAATADYRRFNDHGDVIVFTTPERNRRGQPPIIHRAQFWVKEGENWYDRADSRYVRADECGDSPREALPNCPAPHDGFITRGDANGYYDQVQGLSSPVRPEYIRGTAEVRLPFLGCVRLYFEGTVPQTCRL